MGSFLRALSIVIAVGVCVSTTAIPSLAQTTDGPVLPATGIPVEPIGPPETSAATADVSEQERRMTELTQWMRDYAKWQEWESSQGKTQARKPGKRRQK